MSVRQRTVMDRLLPESRESPEPALRLTKPPDREPARGLAPHRPVDRNSRMALTASSLVAIV